MLTVCLKSAVTLVNKYSAEMRIKVISTLFQQNLLKKEKQSKLFDTLINNKNQQW